MSGTDTVLRNVTNIVRIIQEMQNIPWQQIGLGAKKCLRCIRHFLPGWQSFFEDWQQGAQDDESARRKMAEIERAAEECEHCRRYRSSFDSSDEPSIKYGGGVHFQSSDEETVIQWVGGGIPVEQCAAITIVYPQRFGILMGELLEACKSSY